MISILTRTLIVVSALCLTACITLPQTPEAAFQNAKRTQEFCLDGNLEQRFNDTLAEIEHCYYYTRTARLSYIGSSTYQYRIQPHKNLGGIWDISVYKFGNGTIAGILHLLEFKSTDRCPVLVRIPVYSNNEQNLANQLNTYYAGKHDSIDCKYW